jgi:hypothetical protein
MWWVRLHSFGSEQKVMTNRCEHDNEALGCIKAGKCLAS